MHPAYLFYYIHNSITCVQSCLWLNLSITVTGLKSHLRKIYSEWQSFNESNIWREGNLSLKYNPNNLEFEAKYLCKFCFFLSWNAVKYRFLKLGKWSYLLPFIFFKYLFWCLNVLKVSGETAASFLLRFLNNFLCDPATIAQNRFCGNNSHVISSFEKYFSFEIWYWLLAVSRACPLYLSFLVDASWRI